LHVNFLESSSGFQLVSPSQCSGVISANETQLTFAQIVFLFSAILVFWIYATV